MKRLALLAAAVAACVLPAGALATPSAGIVLTISSRQHAIQVVDPSHVVHAYRYLGPVTSVRPGTRISFTRTGGAIGQLRAARHPSRSVSFLAVLTRVSSRGVSVRLADGKRLSFRARQLGWSGTLRPGTTVLVSGPCRSPLSRGGSSRLVPSPPSGLRSVPDRRDPADTPSRDRGYEQGFACGSGDVAACRQLRASRRVLRRSGCPCRDSRSRFASRIARPS
jgi:hypothetical protein